MTATVSVAPKKGLAVRLNAVSAHLGHAGAVPWHMVGQQLNEIEVQSSASITISLR
jgi:hypothetical protein